MKGVGRGNTWPQEWMGKWPQHETHEL